MRFAKALYPSLDAFFRDLTATAAGSITGFSLFRLPPAMGRSNDGWRRSAVGLGRLSSLLW